MKDQLPLAIRWPSQQQFSDYLEQDHSAAVHVLHRAATGPAAPWAFVSGPIASGKTHLLIAACSAAQDAQRSAQYVSLRDLVKQDAAAHSRRLQDAPAAIGAADAAAVIATLGGSDLLALDDIDAISDNASAQLALFDLYNRCVVEKDTLLFAANAAPAQLKFGLPDLVSRLSACTQIPLKALDETGRRRVLAQRAAARGLVFEDAVLDWLFVHHARDLRSLAALFERIDQAALVAQRRITVPFLRQILGAT